MSRIYNTAEPRGCGRRVEGSVYAETGLSESGMPVEHFLVDPPMPIDAAALGLTARGVKIVEVGGVAHIFDIVGRAHYPGVADFVEEVRRMGASRRLPRTLDFSRLSADSRLVLLHARAHIDNAAEYFQAAGAWRPPGWACPKRLPEHMREDAPPAMCAGLWWLDVEGVEGSEACRVPEGERHTTVAFSADPRACPSLTPVIRRMPAFEYRAWARPSGVTPQYRLASFMVLPIHRLAVIRARDGSHDAALAAARRARDLAVEVCDQ